MPSRRLANVHGLIERRALVFVLAIFFVVSIGGLVEIAGDTWTARQLLEGETFEAGDKVLVHQIEGATAIVVRGI